MRKNLDYLCQLLQQLTPENQYDTITEFVRSSLQFQDITQSLESIDFIDVPDYDKKQYSYTSTTPKPPLITFTQLIGDQKHKQKQNTPKNQSNQQDPPKIKGKHQRGPSKIKDILMSLRAGVITDLQKIADDLLNDPFLHQQLSDSQQNEDQQQYVIEKIKEKIEVMEQQHQEDNLKIELDDNEEEIDENEENSQFREDLSPSMNFQEKKKKKKVRKVSKLTGYNLDIIEEQSYEHITPDKQLFNSILEHRQKSWSSASSGFDQLNLKYESTVEKQEKQSKDLSNSSFRKLNFRQCQSEWVSDNESDTYKRSRYSKGQEDFYIIDEHLEGLDDYDDSQEKAIMDSWNRLCQRIIQKNFLPMECTKIEKQQEAGIFSKIKERRRKQKQSTISNNQSPNYDDICKHMEFSSEILYNKENISSQ